MKGLLVKVVQDRAEGVAPIVGRGSAGLWASRSFIDRISILILKVALVWFWHEICKETKYCFKRLRDLEKI
jgi:hypothetical protein